MSIDDYRVNGLVGICALDDHITHPDKYLNESFEVNFRHFCDDDSIGSINQMDPEDLKTCRKELKDFLFVTQPDVVIFVGVQIGRKFYNKMDVKEGVYEVLKWENTRRSTTVYILPSTREKNRSHSEEEMERYVDGLGKN